MCAGFFLETAATQQPYTAPPSPHHHARACACSKHDCVRMPVDTTHQAAPDEAPSTSSHGAAHEGKPLGKMPLRRAFPYVTSAQRTKDPIEVGQGPVREQHVRRVRRSTYG